MTRRRFPQVKLNSDLVPWGSPQALPSSPVRMPNQSVLPRHQEGTLVTDDPGSIEGIGLLQAGGAEMMPMEDAESRWNRPVTQPEDRNAPPIRDPHHYAIALSFSTNVGNNSSAKVLDAPIGKRNMLAFRNSSATANIYIEFSHDASAASVFKLTAGAIALFDAVVPQDDVYAFGDAANATLSISYSNIP